jgi:hypothetical protein
MILLEISIKKDFLKVYLMVGPGGLKPSTNGL